MSHPAGAGRWFSRLFRDYGIVLALAILCAWFSWRTYTVQQPEGAAGGQQLARELRQAFPAGGTVLVAVRESRDDAELAAALQRELQSAGNWRVEAARGEPAAARRELERLSREGVTLAAIACSPASAGWTVFDDLPRRYPGIGAPRVMAPSGYRGSSFLKPQNLLNIADQIAVIAILAIGMTLVILTGGIDLSVGSLIALSAVLATLLIRDLFGGTAAGATGMTLACGAAVLLCGLVGFLSGALITAFRLPPFIVTLGTMLVGSGLAFQAARGQSINRVPESFVWLGRGADLGLPNGVVLMLVLYATAHLLLSRSRWGRHIYAVGSNERAARLSGVPVTRVLLSVYTISGALAGLGGVVMASQLQSGAPTYGQKYELFVIAAVVVGGTSLQGGQGRVLGTLIGAFVIAVIRNGMNLTGVESYTQDVVLGLVILGAVLLDILKQRGGEWWQRLRTAQTTRGAEA